MITTTTLSSTDAPPTRESYTQLEKKEDATVDELLTELKEAFPELTDEKMLMTTSIIAAVAKNASDKEWIEFARYGTFPEILKLNDAQMEALRGGHWFDAACRALIKVMTGIFV